MNPLIVQLHVGVIRIPIRLAAAALSICTFDLRRGEALTFSNVGCSTE
jgi:hypothetical protein